MLSAANNVIEFAIPLQDGKCFPFSYGMANVSFNCSTVTYAPSCVIHDSLAMFRCIYSCAEDMRSDPGAAAGRRSLLLLYSALQHAI